MSLPAYGSPSFVDWPARPNEGMDFIDRGTESAMPLNTFYTPCGTVGLMLPTLWVPSLGKTDRKMAHRSSAHLRHAWVMVCESPSRQSEYLICNCNLVIAIFTFCRHSSAFFAPLSSTSKWNGSGFVGHLTFLRGNSSGDKSGSGFAWNSLAWMINTLFTLNICIDLSFTQYEKVICGQFRVRYLLILKRSAP